jgi:hypothetical protein
MSEQEELIQDIRGRLGELPKGARPFDLLAFATTIGERYSMTQNEIIRLVMQEAEALRQLPHRVGLALKRCSSAPPHSVRKRAYSLKIKLARSPPGRKAKRK